jgi:RNA polymerase sigma-70 factor (ECF subfamily)
VEQKSEPELIRQTEMNASAPSHLVEQEIEVALRAAVSELPDRCREVFELSRTHGLKYSEIATTLGISVKTVEAQMGKALRTLRVKLAPWLPQSETL